MCNGNGVGIAGVVGFRPDLYDYVPDFYEFTASDATGSDVTTKTLQGLNEAGLNHVLIASIDQDLGAIGGVAVSKAQVRVTPQVQKGLGGGDVWHTYAATATYNRNAMAFGIRLQPNEDFLVEYKPNTNGSSTRVRVVRYRAFRRAMAPA